MKHYKISKSLNDSTVSKFVTRKWVKANDLSGGQYSVNKNIMFKTPMLRRNMYDYSDANIVVKGRITLESSHINNSANKNQAFKNNPQFRSCILKMINTFMDNTKDLAIMMPLYNLLEYSNSYSMTSGSL